MNADRTSFSLQGPLPYFLAAVVAGGLLTFTLLGPFAWLVLLTDGMYAAAVILAAAGLGTWPAYGLLGARSTRMRQFIVSTALGSGILSTAILVLGMSGLLSRASAVALLVIGGAAGLARLYLIQPAGIRGRFVADSDPSDVNFPSSHRRASFFFAILGGALLSIPLGVMFSGACLPPSVLWRGEAGGYDALEYHLQVPREWFEGGQIRFLPHNVYASFPQQVEMQYLLLMHLFGSAQAAAISCQLLHAVYGLLAMLALAVWSKSPWARIATVVAAGTVPWLAYVGCLAYVENGMLFFAAVAGGLMHAATEKGTAAWRIALTAGLIAGLAAGCKYQGLVFVVAALGPAFFVIQKTAVPLRIGRVCLFGTAALLSFSPWLIRNLAFTGNPVYPFAYSLFGGRDWSPEQAEQWQRGHAVPPRFDSLSGRFGLACGELIGWNPIAHSSNFGRDPQFGFGILAAGLLAGLTVRTRPAAANAIWAVLILTTWFWFTHMPGRFAMPVVIPLAFLIGEVFASRKLADGWTALPLFAGSLVMAGALLISAMTLRLYWTEGWQFFQRTQQVPMSAAFGLTSELFGGFTLNKVLPLNTRTYLVGPAAVFPMRAPVAYTVVFNRDPWLTYCAGEPSPAKCVDWLRQRGYSHLVFDLNEIQRLRNTYGFSPLVTPDWIAQLATGGLRQVANDATDLRAAGLLIFEILRR